MLMIDTLLVREDRLAAGGSMSRSIDGQWNMGDVAPPG